jgi:hypothetical protein
MPDPAWYPDPADSARVRWWDGTGWTEHTRELTPAGPVQPEPEPYVPMKHAIEVERPRAWPVGEIAVRPGGPFTAAILLFTLLPLVEAFGPTLLPGADQLVVRAATGIVVIAASIALAFWDRNALDAHGYSRSNLPHPAFAVIPIFYLVVRIFRIGAVSIIFVIIWGGIQAGAYAFEIGDAAGLSGGTLPVGAAPANTSGHDLDPPYSAADRAFLLTVSGMEAKVAHDATTDATVTCQPLPLTTLGATTTCDLQLPAGGGVRETIEVQDESSIEPWIVEGTAPLG